MSLGSISNLLTKNKGQLKKQNSNHVMKVKNTE